jgi:hypothetical protein
MRIEIDQSTAAEINEPIFASRRTERRIEDIDHV